MLTIYVQTTNGRRCVATSSEREEGKGRKCKKEVSMELPSSYLVENNWHVQLDREKKKRKQIMRVKASVRQVLFGLA